MCQKRSHGPIPNDYVSLLNAPIDLWSEINDDLSSLNARIDLLGNVNNDASSLNARKSFLCHTRVESFQKF